MENDPDITPPPPQTPPPPPGGSSGGPSGPAAGGGLSQEERTWALLAHILTLVGGFVAPLVIWLVKKEESAFVADHAKESLNFQITLTIALIISAALVCVWIGVLLMPLVGIYGLVMVILATLKANEGELYEYPFTLRLIQ